jgi:hypothetical protein
MRYLPFAVVAILAIAGCAPTVWDKAGGTEAQFNQESAQCRLMARGMNSGDFYAEGKPAFVAAATIGNAVGTAISTAATYRDCMMAVGYTPRAPGSAEPTPDDNAVNPGCLPGQPCVCGANGCHPG